MASFGTLTLLLAFALLAGPDGGYAFDAMRAAPPTRRRRRPRASSLALIGAGSKAGSCRCTSGCRSPIPPRRATSPR